MHVAPDPTGAERDARHVAELVRGCLSVTIGPEIRHPGFPALAHEIGRTPPADLDERVRQVTADAVRSAERAATERDGGWWAVDPAPPAPHLDASLRRAVAGLPARPDRIVDLALAAWDDEQRATAGRAREMLAGAWPEMAAELAVTVRQVALLDGWGIDGYTDFAVHGAIFVNAARLRDGPDGLPAAVRVAEALVHEGTHTRCNAAAAARPVLASAAAAAGAGPGLPTPLRADPRPLAGLFQQVLVLARGVELYDRLPGTGQPERARRERLLEQGRTGAVTLAGHLDALTAHGRELVAEAADVLARPVGSAR